MAMAWLLVPLLLCLLLMQTDGGVPGFTKLLKQYSAHAWRPLARTQTQPVDHLCLDMNYLLHRRCESDSKRSIKRLFNLLDDAMDTLRPRKSVVFAFDGPAPFAKLALQRSRRGDSDERMHLSVGTKFMDEMEDTILCYVLQRLHRTRFRDLSFFISGSGSPGEGEIKLMHWVRTHVASHNDSVAIYGMDADLLLQAMALPQPVSVVQVGSSSNQICHVPTLLASLRPDLLADRDRVEDCVLPLVLFGCDYLPKLSGVSRQRLLESLPHATGLLDASRRTFNFSALHDFLSRLDACDGATTALHSLTAQRGLYVLWQEEHAAGSTEWNVTCKIARNVSGLLEVLHSFSCEKTFHSKREGRELLSQAILPLLDVLPVFSPSSPAAASSLPGSTIFHFEVDKAGVSATPRSHHDTVREYLRGLLWVTHLYTRAQCSDWSFAYHSTRSVSPRSIIAFLNATARQVGSFHSLHEALQMPAVQHRLAQLVSLPLSALPPLSSSAACVSVFPTLLPCIPTSLHSLWHHLNTTHFSLSDGHPSGGYEGLLRRLREHSHRDVVAEDSAEWLVVAPRLLHSQASYRLLYGGLNRLWMKTPFNAPSLPDWFGMYRTQTQSVQT